MKQSINLERIQELKEMDEPGSDEVQRQLVEMYISSTPSKISLIRASQNDKDELKKAAHSLKSTSVNMGCDHLAELCRQIEQGEGIIKDLIDQCEDEFEKIKQEFKRLYP